MGSVTFPGLCVQRFISAMPIQDVLGECSAYLASLVSPL